MNPGPDLGPSRTVVNVRHWPGRENWRPPAAGGPVERLAERITCTVVALPETGAVPERLGLGAWVLALGGTILDAGIFHHDDLDSPGRRRLTRWAKAQPIPTPLGRRPPRVMTATAFSTDVFYRSAYIGRATVVGANLGRTLGLIAADVRTSAKGGAWGDGWTLGFSGWGVVTTGKDGHDRWNRSTGRPVLRLSAMGAYGVRAAFGPPRASFDDERRGQWETTTNGRKAAYRGRFVDVIAAAFAFDGVESDDLDDHLRSAGVPPVGAPYAVKVDAGGAATVTALASAVHDLAMTVDTDAAHWAGGLDVTRLHSPATVGAQVLTRIGLTPPLARFGLSDAELSAWEGAFHGGWVDVAPGLAKVAFPGVDLDIGSAYPAVASLLGWWDHMAAAEVQARPVTREFRAFLASPGLAEAMYDPATWRRWGLTRVTLRPTGQPLPVVPVIAGDIDEPRLRVIPTHAERFEATWLDAVAATLAGGRPPEVLEAVQLVAWGRADGLGPVKIPGATLHPDVDPAVTLARLRKNAKARGDGRTAAQLRIMGNALTFGNPARFDPTGGGGERPGPWCWPPLASTVTAGCRALLVMAETDIARRGGIVAYRDTDGVIVAGSDSAATLKLIDGTTAAVLSRTELDEVRARFDRLDPFGDGTPLWAEKAAGTVTVWGPKRYAIVNADGELTAHTEHVLGSYAGPPGAGGRTHDGQHVWTVNVARDLAVDGRVGAVAGGWDGFPAMRRFDLAHPDEVAEMGNALGMRPFSRVVEAESVDGTAHPVALDPGGDLAGWDELAWHDTHTGRPTRVTTDHTEPGHIDHARRAAQVGALADEAGDWAQRPVSPAPPAITVDPALVRLVGREGVVFRDGIEASTQRGLDPAAILTEAARHLRAPGLAALTGLPERTARALTAGRAPTPATVKRAEAVLRTVLGPDPLPALLDLAHAPDPAIRLAELGLGAPVATCGRDGCEVRIGSRQRWCSDACRKAHGRAGVRAAS